MVKKGNRQVNVVANPTDQDRLEFLQVKLGLKPTQIYRLALAMYYRKERSEED